MTMEPTTPKKKTQKSKPSKLTKKTKGPFGVIHDAPRRGQEPDDGRVDPQPHDLEFTGSPSDLLRALESSFLKPSAPPPQPATAKKVVASAKTIKKVVVGKRTAAPPQRPYNPFPQTATQLHKAAPLDRNQDGVTKEEIERAKHLIANVVEVDPKLKTAYTTNLNQITKDFTEFLLTTIAPYEGAIDTAMADAAESIQLITGTQSASFDLGRADTLLRRLPELMTLEWVCKRLTVSDDIRELLINEYMGKERGKNHSDQVGLTKVLSQLQSLSQLQRPAKRAQSPVPKSSPRTKR